jgi:hypothetical protein
MPCRGSVIAVGARNRTSRGSIACLATRSSLLFVATAGAIVVNTLIATPKESTIGLAFIALGIPVYYAQRAFKARGAGTRS